MRVLLQTLDTCPEGRGQSLSLSTCHNADGKVKVQRSFAVGETFLVLHSKAVLQLFPKLLQWMGTFFKMCLETLEPKLISRGYLDPFQRRNINLTQARCNDPSASVALL